MRGELKNNSLDSALDECGEDGASNQNSKLKMRSQLSVGREGKRREVRI